ncbi:putative monooxygenase [Anaerolineae bacterium]|nr:putative monooxygenase [Anaerolineae bacterium]
MAGFHTNIEKKTLDNSYFREVLYTGPNSQLVVMSLKPGEDIGMETHGDVDQFIRVEAGSGKAVLNGKEHVLEDGSAVVIPAGVEHNIVNTSRTEPMKLYSIYSPPEHPHGTVHKNKGEAEEYEKKKHS